MPSTVPSSEQTGLQLESTIDPISTATTSSISTATGLQVITSPEFPTLVVELDHMITNPTSLVVSTLVSMKTHPRLLPISLVALMTAPAMPSTIVTTKLLEIPPSKLTRSPRVIEVEEEFMADMIDTF